LGRSQREKGKRGERAAAEVLRALGFTDCRRGRQYAGHPDAPDVVGIPGAHLEVKVRQAGNVTRWLEEAAEDGGPERVPLVMHKRNGEVFKITFFASDIWRLYRLLSAAQSRGCDVEST
jgi:hypothetical protein